MNYATNTGTMLRYMYPSAVPLRDYVVEQIAAGEVAITHWDASLGAQPTPAEIAAAELPAAKAARIAAIKAERDRRKFEGVYVGQNRFHSDADSRTQQLGLVLLGAGVPPVEWKTLTPDGEPDVYVTMTPTLAQQIFGATATRDIACFNHAKTLIASVNAAQTVEAVAAVDISTGWPE